MKIYLVGGAVRDLLLKKVPKDRDYVVVGATPEDLLSSGDFKPVGKSFPVFIHKETGDEYALARTEKKNGAGHTGFSVNFSPKISLIEDLKRRDLTINALAQDLSSNKIIDPFNGKKDLEKKILRHTSDAFSEDPLRVLRVARFSSRFPDFSIHQDTLTLMKQIVKSNDFKSLSKERILKELKSSLQEDSPQNFFLTLKDCGGLSSLEGINSSFIFSLKKESSCSFLKFLSKLSVDSLMQYNNFCKKFPLSNEERKISSLIAEYHLTLESPKAQDLLEFFVKSSSYQSDHNLKKILSVSRNIVSAQDDIIIDSLNSSKNIPSSLISKFDGKALGLEIKKYRLSKIKETLSK